MKRAAYADGNDRVAANHVARFAHGAREPFLHLRHEIPGDFGKHKDEFITAQPADLVVLPAGGFELRGHFLKQLVSRQVTEFVVDLFEPVQVAQQHCKRPLGAPDARKFLVKMEADRSGVGQAGQIIGAGGALRLFELERIFDGEPEFRAGREEQAQMILREAVFLTMVKSKDTGDTYAASERDAHGRLQVCDARRRTEMESFRGRIAIGYRFFVARDPA